MQRKDLRFTISGMLFVMFVCSVIGAGGSLLWRTWKNGADTMIFFFGFVLLGPFVMMICASLLRSLLIRINKRPQPPQKKS